MSELISFEPVILWTKVKYIVVNDINGQRNRFEDAEFRITDKALFIRDKENLCIVYTLDNVVKYFYLPDISPHTK
jgi:hypothetical protein